MYNGYKRYNKDEEPRSVLLSHLLYKRYTRVTLGGIRRGYTGGTQGVYSRTCTCNFCVPPTTGDKYIYAFTPQNQCFERKFEEINYVTVFTY